MTTQTLQNRLAKRFTGSKASLAYKTVNNIATGKTLERKIRPVTTSGTGRFCKNMDYTSDICSLLNLLGVKFTFTNDSPRGGLTGNLITIESKIVN
jgi:hypothetical protein